MKSFGTSKDDSVWNVIIAGGREFTNYVLLANALDLLLKKKLTTHKIQIVCGKARGADSLGERYAKERGYTVLEYPAEWDKYGKRAGYMRNEQMAKVANCTVAFWDGSSKGTEHMINLSVKYKLELRTIRY